MGALDETFPTFAAGNQLPGAALPKKKFTEFETSQPVIRMSHNASGKVRLLELSVWFTMRKKKKKKTDLRECGNLFLRLSQRPVLLHTAAVPGSIH